MAQQETAQDQPELTGQLMFYRKPEALSPQRHRGLGVKQVPAPFEFLRAENAVPLTIFEFAAAAVSYPIIFAGPSKAPLAMMGIREGANVFVNDDGVPDPEAYIPLAARCYPFALAADTASDKLILCIDRAAPMVGEQPEAPFFDGEAASAFTTNAMELCKRFEECRAGTARFLQRVTELDLWTEKDVTLTPPEAGGQPAEPINIAAFFAISEEKLTALPAAQAAELHKEGWLGAIYAHLISQQLWPKILSRGLAIGEARVNAAARAN